jgi:type IV pilus assembly protein PilV
MPSSPKRNFKHATTRTPHTRRLQDAVILKKTSRSSSGFTLIETIVALTILAVGVLGVAAGLLSALKVSAQSRANTEAIFLAEQQLEIFRIMTIGEVVAMANAGAVSQDTENPLNPEDDSSMTFNRSWQIELDTPATNVISLTVTVAWTDKDGVVRSTELRTFKASS